MNLRLALILIIITLHLGAYSQFGPGGVGDATTNKLWLCSDKDVTLSGSLVTSWLDQSGNANDPLGITPLYRSSVAAINNMPAINFATSGPYENIFNLTSSNFSVFSVYVGATDNLTPLWGTFDTHGGFWPSFDDKSWFPPDCDYESTKNPVAVGQGAISTLRHLSRKSEMYFDGKKGKSKNRPYCSDWLASFSIGGSNFYGGYTGDISEIFFYDGEINKAQRRIVENYLGAKYGLSLNKDLYEFDDTHQHEVAGIGRQGGSNIHTDSQGTGIVRISNPSGLGGDEYLFWGHNNEPLISDVFDCGVVTLRRNWMVDEKGEVGSVKIQFDLASIPGDPLDSYLLIDVDGNGFSDDPPVSGNIVGSYLEFNNIDLEKGNSFTLGQAINQFYAVSPGNTSDPIWSINGPGVGRTVTFCDKIDVIIPAGHSIVNDLPVLETKDFEIMPGAFFDLGSARMEIHGDWMNDGIFVSGLGEVSFEGTTGQTINHGNTQTWDNLTVNNSSGVSIVSGTHQILGTLNIKDGNFETNDEVTLISNSVSTARLAELTSGTITGDLNVERYFNTNVNGWHNICSPIKNLTYEDWDDDLITTGIAGSDYPNFPFQSIWTYDETLPGHKDNGIGVPASMADAINNLTGSWVYIASGNQKIDAKGEVFTGNLSFPLTYTNSGRMLEDGWNLVANPYPSTIDWDDPSWIKTNINNAIAVWDPVTQQYTSYLGGIGINGGSQYVPSGQSFWIQSNAANPSLVINEAVKSEKVASFKSGSTIDFIKLIVSNGNLQDETALKIDADSNSNFDPMNDALKISSPNEFAPKIASWSRDSILLSINTLPFDYDNVIEVPLEVWGYEGEELSITAMQNSELSRCIFLEDSLTGTYIDIMNESYTFENYNEYSNRFILHVSQLLDVTSVPVACSDDIGGQLIIEAHGEQPWTMDIKDESNSPISFSETNSGFIASDLDPGYYTIDFGNESKYCKSSTETVEIESKNPVVAQFLMEPSVIDLKYTNEVQFTNATENGEDYLWSFGNDLFSTEENPIQHYLGKGKYEVTLNASAGPCSSEYSRKLTVLDTRILVEPTANISVKLRSISGVLKAIKPSEAAIDRIDVYNATGQLLHKQDWENGSPETIINLTPTSNLLMLVFSDQNGNPIATDRVIH